MAIWRTHVFLLLLFSYLITTCNHKYFTKFSCYCNFISFHLISSHFISFHLISSHFISFHLISSHFISFHLISSHFISFHLFIIFFVFFIVPFMSLKFNTVFMFIWHVNNICLCELICFVQNVNTQSCLNECWISQENETAGLHIEGYNMFFQRGNRVGHGHCGVWTYHIYS